MRVEEAFLGFRYTVTAPVDLNELGQFGLSDSKVQQWDKEDRIMIYIWILNSNKGILHPEVVNTIIRRSDDSYS
jgi:hypothetical protein